MRDWLKARWWWGGAKKYVEPRLRGLLKGQKVGGTTDVLAGISNHKPGFLFPISASPPCSIWLCQVKLTAGQTTVFLPPFLFIFLMTHNENINILSFLLAKGMTSNMDWLYIWYCSSLWLLIQDVPGFELFDLRSGVLEPTTSLRQRLIHRVHGPTDGASVLKGFPEQLSPNTVLILCWKCQSQVLWSRTTIS